MDTPLMIIHKVHEHSFVVSVFSFQKKQNILVTFADCNHQIQRPIAAIVVFSYFYGRVPKTLYSPPTCPQRVITKDVKFLKTAAM